MVVGSCAMLMEPCGPLQPHEAASCATVAACARVAPWRLTPGAARRKGRGGTAQHSVRAIVIAKSIFRNLYTDAAAPRQKRCGWLWLSMRYSASCSVQRAASSVEHEACSIQTCNLS
jgi:hypothetical protein